MRKPPRILALMSLRATLLHGGISMRAWTSARLRSCHSNELRSLKFGHSVERFDGDSDFSLAAGTVARFEGLANHPSCPQFPNKFPPALMRDRFCRVRRLRWSQVRVAGHLRRFVVAHGESRWNRVQLERVAPPSRAHGASPPFQGTALDMASRVGNARFSLIRPVHAPAPAASGGRRGSSPAPRLRRPVE